MNRAALYASIALLPVFAFAPLSHGGPDAQPASQLEKLKAPPKVGDTMPMFTIADATGEGQLDLSEMLKSGPVVVTFFRGSWCPYCRDELSAVQDHLQQITEAGASVLAISPQRQSDTQEMIKQKKFGFQFATDHDNELATKLALSFKLDAKTIQKYKQYGIDLPKTNDAKVWQLPIPAAYIIDTDGTIAWAFVDEDYSKRPDYNRVVQKLKDMQGDG